MRNGGAVLLLAAMAGLTGQGLALAASEAEFQAAYAAAEAANREAGALKNQWTTTATTLAEAKKAAVTGDYDKAVALAKKADALAQASIEQSKREDKAWRNALIR